MKNSVLTALIIGMLASLGMMGFYFLVVSLISGMQDAQLQLLKNWYFIIPLAYGFGIQIGLFSYLRAEIRNKASAGSVATTGATTTAAMISCCAHYLVNVAPALAAVGVISFLAQYQVKFFIIGMIANFLGIMYLVNKIVGISKMK